MDREQCYTCGQNQSSGLRCLQITLLVVKHSLVPAEGYLEYGLVVCCKDVAKCISYIGTYFIHDSRKWSWRINATN